MTLKHLHSTMYLLNLLTPFSLTWSIKFTFHYVSIKSVMRDEVGKFLALFTFHYVSIKSQNNFQNPYAALNLHSTMYLLNHRLNGYRTIPIINLHSTMYLLNPVPQHLIISQAYFVLFCRPTIIHCNKICIHQKLSLFTA